VTRCRESTEESVNDDTGVKQLPDRARRQRSTAQPLIAGTALSGLLPVVEIRPVRWNQRTRAIGQDEHEMQQAPAVGPPEHLQRFVLEGVVLTEDSYALGIPIKVVVGSLSCLPSTRFRTTS
jgi:hypothetical protein